MNNFLTNLVTRSIGPAPEVLRPRLPSLFEAPTGNEPILGEAAGFTQHQDTVEQTPMINIDRYRVERRVARQPDHESPPPAEVRSQHEENHRAIRRTILPYEPESQMDEPIKAGRETQFTVTPSVSIVKDPGKLKQVLPENQQMEMMERFVRKNEGPKSGEIISPRHDPRMPRIVPQHHTPQNGDDSDAEVVPGEHYPPTVRINIGRIEVRAVTQPVPPARTIVSKQPKLTLDEYLDNRNKGKR